MVKNALIKKLRKRQTTQATIRRTTNKPAPPERKTKVPVYTKGGPKKVCIIQTGCWGDSVNSTLMLKPIRKHFGECIIDVHTSTCYASALQNNPLIDNLIEYEAASKRDALHLTLTIPESIKKCGYDIITAPHPMFNPGKWSCAQHQNLGENLIYAWVRALEELKIPYELPLETILRLTEQEITKTQNFIKSIDGFKKTKNILMEIHGESGQTFWDHTWTMAVSRLLLEKGHRLLLSRKFTHSDIKELIPIAPERVHFVGHLTIRECAELFNHCDMFMSVSSGLSNACNTNWCKKDIKWIETVNSKAVNSAPIRKNGKIFWYKNKLNEFLKMLKEQI